MEVPLYHSGTGLLLAGLAVCVVGLLVVTDHQLNEIQKTFHFNFFLISTIHFIISLMISVSRSFVALTYSG